MIDGSVNNVHQSSIMTGDIDGNGTLDVAIAEQEQSSTKRVAVYFNTAGDASTWSQQILSTSGGHNAKLGIIGNDRLPSIVNANHGVYGAPNPVELFRNQLSAPASTTTSSAPQELPIVSEPSTTHRMRDA
jgi:hypothetical protein